MQQDTQYKNLNIVFHFLHNINEKRCRKSPFQSHWSLLSSSLCTIWITIAQDLLKLYPRMLQVNPVALSQNIKQDTSGF
jgi:hypothetical protein